MSVTELDELRECCTNEKMYLIIYDGAITPDLPILVCKACFENNPIFQRFIKQKTLLQKTKSYG